VGVFRPGLRPGDVLTSEELRQRFKCQQGKGMRCSAKTNTLVLVLDRTRQSALSVYADEWDDEGVLHYCGMGLRGDQDIEREGNRWLRDAKKNGTGVFLFEKKRPREFTYVGEVELAGEPYRRREPDIDGNPRWVWVFPLRLVGSGRSVVGSARPSRVVPGAAETFARPRASSEPPREAVVAARQEPSHEEIQWRLLELGALLGLDVWVATDDRSKSYAGRPFADAPRLRETLPAHLAPAAQSVIEHVDVLWLRGERIEAAFEVEHITSDLSGLLRLADLVAVQPNVRFRLYVVAPDSRRAELMSELSRPVFDALKPPLRTICGFIPYSRLLQEFEAVKRYWERLRPGFLQTLAEFADDTAPRSGTA